ncbi:MAG: hypothetical protein CVV64_12380 [Candidatus Wallbacteria bacterium HGW-Wallbacteria-1]|jgi:two-component system response regulator AtoC|uniref:Sigma-54-dependent Fis family transcriptional regulator n=1 Tax=Candidatus Wallbacteria bacterium HGW-Wallbacteria-1 TaxID=2013854 RepID=A0A2N1PNA3_9BACT|nr:MAG: hypothetical protein CVV64_12380 [Candidatus Wallbacteria bacterium HGW-Wallbacteria-1]
MKNLLIIDDDRALGRSLQLQMQTLGFTVQVRATGEEGLEAIDSHEFDVLFLDLTLPDIPGLQILQRVTDLHPEVPVIVISGRQDMDATINAIKFGAFDYIRKPLDMDSIILVLEKIRFQKIGRTEFEGDNSISARIPDRELVGSTPEMLDLLKQIGSLSRNHVPVLIQGESGTGKELVARALHKAGGQDRPFIAINCSSVVPTLLESELFGHEKGAFTGADRQKTGKLEAAGSGTVFFDEIGDLSLDLQSRLLRVLQENEFERVGGLSAIPFRARSVFATHRDLAEMVSAGTFRQDLYYRIAVARLLIPPLRNRRQDIEAISIYLLQKIAHSQNISISGILPEAMTLLQTHNWPGNVRELENVLTRAAALSYSGTITADNIRFEDAFLSPAGNAPSDEKCDEPFRVRPLSEIERESVLKSLDATEWNISQTARLLEISPTTLRKKISDYQLSHNSK